MKQNIVQVEELQSDNGPAESLRNSAAFPQCGCSRNLGNGMFVLNVSLQGSLESPPFLARLYCRNGSLGRFRIYLKEEKLNSSIQLSGLVNVRYGDIMEWINKRTKNLGFVDENGIIIKLNPGYYSAELHEKLKKYLKTKEKQYIIKYFSTQPINDSPGKINPPKQKQASNQYYA